MIGHSLSSIRWLCALILVALLVLFVVAACGTQSGEELLEENCTGCHTLTIIGVSSKTAHEWLNTVYRMKKLGADVSDREVDIIVEYLTTQFGPTAAVP
ncbi:MAG TPA: cytochrome c [Anaerolineae bacterium]|nr:cytochrome c [Anaerolineae bacterium]